MRLLALISLTCLLASCAGSRQADACRYRERDLTVDFAQRTYWCIPGDRK